jgi:iron complex outermembrane receptor protein
VIRNGTLVGAGFSSNSGEVDNIYRPNAGGESWYLDLNGRFRVTDDLSFTGKLGKTHGVGYDRDDVYYQNNVDGGMMYALNGLTPATVSYPGGNTDEAGLDRLGRRRRGAVGRPGKVRAGRRRMAHARQPMASASASARASRTTSAPPNTRSKPVRARTASAIRARRGTARCIRATSVRPRRQRLQHYFKYDGAALGAWGAVPGNRLLDYTLRHNWLDEFQVGEKTAALYGMAEFGGDGWSGNAGLRAVETRQTTVVNLPGGTSPITGSAFGPYTPTTYKRTYRDYLPSVNLKFDVRPDLVVRAAHRQDHGASRLQRAGRLGVAERRRPVRQRRQRQPRPGALDQLRPVGRVVFRAEGDAVGRPVLHGPRSIVAQGTSTGSYYNNKRGAFTDYQITSPYNTSATNKGVELSWQQPLWNNFGILANYTYADGELDDGGEMLNSSKNTYNVTGYFENERFSARLAYSYRSAYKAGVDRGASQHVDSMPSLAASVNVKLTEHLTLTFDALNLTNETIKMYAENKDRPRAFYSNGRTFYLGLRGKL